jgi:hypothetical protein
MCRRDLWTGTYNLFGIDRIEEWTYCHNSRDDQPCRRIYIHDHGDIAMAPERPRSAGYDIHFEPRIIERKPEGEVCDNPIPKTKRSSKKLTFGFKFGEFFRPVKIKRVQPKSILRRPEPEPEPELVDPDYVQLREPRRSPPRPISPRRPPRDEFVPLPSPVPSPRRHSEEEAPIVEIRSPRGPPIIHPPSPPLREHRRRPARSPSPEPIREVETIRIRRLDKTDRGKAQRHRARNVEEEARRERERRHDAEDVNRRLAEIAMRERSERLHAERDARNAVAQRRSAEIAAADLQRENDRLGRERRVAEREAAVLEEERERERERVRNALGRPQDVYRPAREPRDVHQPMPADRGAAVIQAAQEARRHRRGERISHYPSGRRIE